MLTKVKFVTFTFVGLQKVYLTLILVDSHQVGFFKHRFWLAITKQDELIISGLETRSVRIQRESNK